MHIDPTTTETMNDAAPRSSPTAKLPEWAFMAENVEKTSGLPFPIAKKVTPATFSSRPRTVAIVARFGQKKSDATIPSIANSKANHTSSPKKTANRITADDAQKYACRCGSVRKVSVSGHA